jgi:hypothetical protein
MMPLLLWAGRDKWVALADGDLSIRQEDDLVEEQEVARVEAEARQRQAVLLAATLSPENWKMPRSKGTGRWSPSRMCLPSRPLEFRILENGFYGGHEHE